MTSRICSLTCVVLLLLCSSVAAQDEDTEAEESAEESSGPSATNRKAAFDEMNAGMRAYREERYAEAVDYLKRAVHLNKLSPKPWYWLGQAHLAMAQHEEARAAFETTLDIDDGEFRARVGLGEALFHLGKLDRAKEIFESVKENLDPPKKGKKSKSTNHRDYAPAHEGLARLYAAQNKDAEARAEFETAIKVDATYVEGIVSYGDFLRERGDLRGAEALYLRAISVDRSFALGYVSLGRLYLKSEMYREAGGVYRRLLKERPASDLARLRLSETALLEGDAVGATQFIGSVSDSPLYQLEAEALLARIFFDRGDYEEAIAIIDDAVAALDRETEPIQTEALWRARLGRQKGKYQGARDLVAAKTIDEDLDRSAAFDLGVESLRLGDAETARALFQRTVDAAADGGSLGNAPFRVAALVNLGLAESRLGDSEAAIAAYRLALELDPDQPDAHLYLANALYRTGHARKALVHYEDYLRIMTPDAAGSSRRDLRLKVSHLVGELKAELENAS